MVELYGYLDTDTKDWVDGLFANIYRDMNRPIEREVNHFVLILLIHSSDKCKKKVCSGILVPFKSIFISDINIFIIMLIGGVCSLSIIVLFRVYCILY